MNILAAIPILVVISSSSFSESKSKEGTPVPSSKEIVSLKDFTAEEVRSAGFAIEKEMTLHLSAVGGGEKSFWRELVDDNEDSQRMYAYGWIINADTREPVWEMSMENTSGKSDHRTCEENVMLKKGSYEVYFSAFAYAQRTPFSNISTNIDRRKKGKRINKWVGTFLRMISDDDREVYDEFMDRAKNEWGITVSAPDEDAASIRTFSAPLKNPGELFSATRVGDDAVIKKALTVKNDVTIHVYSVGEGRKKDDMFDYGWIVNSATRERVWQMSYRSTRFAGGAAKNRVFNGDVTLAKGSYELFFITDASHSNDDWNSAPPFDPYNYGVTLSLRDENNRNAIKISDAPDTDKNVILKLVELEDNDFKNEGFSLKKDTKVRVYAVGEMNNGNNEMADYGWIVNAKTRERVWTMEARSTYHAGGASKNRMADDVVELPKGDYLVYYQTDGSHSYDHWNDDPPYDQEHWGITVMGAGDEFDTKSFSSFSEDREQGVLVQLVRVGDDRHVRKQFSLERPTTVRVYAVGEGRDDEMFDYGWIENLATGERMWEMTYEKTTRAGGARKNRMVSQTLHLDKGTYEVHFRTDGSHAFNDWNDDPPEDRTHWGITIYKE